MPMEQPFTQTKTFKSFLNQYQPTYTKKDKTVSAEEAVRMIRDNDTVVFGGFAGVGACEEIAAELEKYYIETGAPKNLTLMFAVATGPGNDTNKGLNHLGHEGLIKRIIGGHWGLAPRIQKLAVENKVVAYNLPQGIISHMYRNIASQKFGIFSDVGLGTFVDPRNGGGKLNEKTTEDIVRLMEIDGEEYLYFTTLPINVAVIRGTTADTNGNISMEKEALTLESLSIAMAARNSGGLVIAQVERVAQVGTINSRDVKIPGILVDGVVVARPENHWQTFGEVYNPAFSGEMEVPMDAIPSMELSCRKIIARRAAFEIEPNCVVNLGIGVPEGIANVANEEQILDFMTMTAEPGVIGGLPAGGINFGAATNATALIDQPYQFDFYNGGGVDVAFLGMAEADKDGNVNVSRFGKKLSGAGGFINISQNSKKVIFMGTFTAGGMDYAIEDGHLNIKEEGKFKKFVDKVNHITFSGIYGARSKRKILYVTERCVFELGQGGPELVEIAPGLDLEKDILAHMEFRPAIREPLQQMDERIFRDDKMGLKEDLLSISLDDRIAFDYESDTMFANLAGYTVKSIDDINAIGETISNLLKPLGRKVHAIGNYDQFNIDSDLIEPYSAMQQDLVENYFSRVSRYTTSAFLRMKLGDALEKRGVAPHIYESADEAHGFLKN